MQQEEERHGQEMQQKAASAGEVIQVNGIESEVKLTLLTAEEHGEKLHSSLSYRNPNLSEKEKIHTTEMLLKNHSSFSLDVGELGRAAVGAHWSHF